MKTIAVVFAKGGMGDVGKHVVAHAIKQEGLRVRALARPTEFDETESIVKVNVKDLPKDRLEIIEADPASDVEALKKCFEGVDAVISCIGNRQPNKWAQTDRWGARGAANIVTAMKSTGVKRLVMISSPGVAESWPPMRWSWAGVVFRLLYVTLLRTCLRDLTAMEDAVKRTDLDYLIVRPTGLTPTKQIEGKYYTLVEPPSKGQKVGIEVAKEDVSAFMLAEALQPTHHAVALTVGGKI